jgi:hypothetical protein
MKSNDSVLYSWENRPVAQNIETAMSKIAGNWNHKGISIKINKLLSDLPLDISIPSE